MKPPTEFHSERHSVISPEKVHPNVPYTFTWNPDDAHQGWKAERETDRISQVRAYFINLVVNKLNATIKAELEVSPLGRLHFHGTIKFNSLQAIKRFYVMDIRNLLNNAQIEIDSIEDDEVWDTYCRKQNEVMQEHTITTGKLNLRDSKLAGLYKPIGDY